MSPDPLALLLAATLTSGCATVHVLRRHADATTFVLVLVAYALATAVGTMLAIRFALVMAPDHAGGWMYVAVDGL